MSDRYLEWVIACEHGEWNPHQTGEPLLNEDGSLNHVSVCRGATHRKANGQRVEPDYESALAEYLRLQWAEDGMGPYAEELADVVLPNGVKVPRISNFEEAKRIVDAAIGDKFLIDPTTEEEE